MAKLTDGMAGVRVSKNANEDQNLGINIARRVMEAPLREIVANYGYNAATGEYGDMIAFGILGPARTGITP